MKPPFSGKLCLVKNKPLLDFPVSLVVKTSRFCCRRQMGSIPVRGLISHLPPDVAKKKKKRGLKNELPFLRGHTQTHTHIHTPGPSSARGPAPLPPEGICSVMNLCSRASLWNQKKASLQLRSLSCLDLYSLPCPASLTS